MLRVHRVVAFISSSAVSIGLLLDTMWLVAISKYRHAGDASACFAARQKAAAPGSPATDTVALMYVRVKGNASSGLRQMHRLGEAGARLRRAARLDPLAFDGIVELAHRPGDEPLLADLDRWATGAAQVARQGLAVAGTNASRKTRWRDAVGDVLERTGHDEAAVREADQRDLVQVLEQHVVHEVAHVGAQVDQRARQVDALAEAGEARREDRVAGGLQQPPDMAEAVRAAPRAVDEDERGHGFARWQSRRARRICAERSSARE